MRESAETSEVKAATLTNHPYGAGLAEQQAAADFMGRRDEYVFFSFQMSCCQQVASRLQACYIIAGEDSVYRVYVYDSVSTSFLPTSDTTGAFFSFLGFSPYVPAVSDPG